MSRIDQYARELGRELRSLPHDRRQFIVAQTQDYLMEWERYGHADMDSAISSLGKPASYARQFTLTRSKLPSTRGVVLSALAVALVGAIFFGASLLTLGDILMPANTGLFVGDAGLRYGIWSGNVLTDTHEVMGALFIPVHLACAGTAFFVLRWLVRI